MPDEHDTEAKRKTRVDHADLKAFKMQAGTLDANDTKPSNQQPLLK